MNAFFTRLTWKFFPGRFYLSGMSEDMRESKRLLREINKYTQEKSEPFLRQMEFLGNPAPDPVSYPLPTLHHDLDIVANQLELEVGKIDPGAPFVCSIAIGEEYRSKVAPCLAAARDYCQLHGYNYVLLTKKPEHFQRHLYSLKFPLLWRALNLGSGDLFYLDTDALITNPTIKLETFFQRLDEQRRHVLITKDIFGVNCGLYFLKNSLKSRVLLNLLWEYRCYSFTWYDFGDQGAVHDLLNRYPIVENLFLQAEQREFNSYISGGPTGAWQKGDFILHFAGIDKARMDEMIRQHQIDVPR